MDKYAVVGNPIGHSLSPQIHTLFADETDQILTYEALKLEPKHFEKQIKNLMADGFKGVNVTVPFKLKAMALADRVSPRAKDVGSVNTLIFQPDGLIAGDNTDGMGLARDLINNHQILISHRRILILGAGGAVRGILGTLLSKKPDLVTVANRTLKKAEKLAKDFAPLGDIQICEYKKLGQERFDLIINGTSAGLNDEIPPIPDEVLGANTICYDLMYDVFKNTAFVQWAIDHGALRAFDGLGMLVEQAAESFYIWRGVRAQTVPVIEILRDPL